MPTSSPWSTTRCLQPSSSLLSSTPLLRRSLSAVTSSSSRTGNLLSNSSRPSLYSTSSTVPPQNNGQKTASTTRLRLAAACQGKLSKQPTVNPIIPKLDPAQPSSIQRCNCGEDSFFIAETPSWSVFGVCDGVGGWADVGVDPSQFAWAMSNESEQAALEQYDPGSAEAPHPTKIIEKAYERILKKRQVAAGSSTVLIASYSKSSSTLHVSNLGDCSLAIFRPSLNMIIAETPVLQYSFNTPAQLSVIPESEKNLYIESKPQEALSFGPIKLNPGDIIVAGTDGFFDNVFPSKLLPLFPEPRYAESDKPGQQNSPQGSKTTSNSAVPQWDNYDQLLDPTEIAQRLLQHAHRASLDARRDGPFAISAKKHGYYYQGGKRDDITIVVGVVVAENEPKTMALL